MKKTRPLKFFFTDNSVDSISIHRTIHVFLVWFPSFPWLSVLTILIILKQSVIQHFSIYWNRLKPFAHFPINALDVFKLQALSSGWKNAKQTFGKQLLRVFSLHFISGIISYYEVLKRARCVHTLIHTSYRLSYMLIERRQSNTWYTIKLTVSFE